VFPLIVAGDAVSSFAYPMLTSSQPTISLRVTAISPVVL
jgi:hypothetical protein